MNGISTNRRCTSSAACLKSKGIDFVVRYYSETTQQPEKAVTPVEAKALSDAGLRLATVYQDRQNQVADFSRPAGLRDGQFAHQYAREIGQPAGTTIFFAVDFDATTADMTAIRAHFGGVRDGLAAAAGGAAPYRVGVYGSGKVCRLLLADGLAVHSWLAEATGWSESSTFTAWNLKQFVTHGSICNVAGYERCTSQGSDTSWSFTLAGASQPATPLPSVDVNTLPVLRRGAKGADVQLLQRLLNAWLSQEGALHLVEDGDFGAKTSRAALAFQSSNADNFGVALRADGVVGGLTWGALLRVAERLPDPPVHAIATNAAGQPWWTSMPNATFGGSARALAALQAAVAEAKAGAGESGGNNLGPDVDRYLNGLAPAGSNWCAGFVSWCLKQSGPMPFPYTVGARDILTKAKNAGLTISKDPVATRPLPGDIIVWWRVSPTHWFGHTGYVHHVDQGRLFTIEGNKTSRVQGFDYPLASVEKLLGIVRF